MKKKQKTRRKKTVATQLVIDSAQLTKGNKVKKVKATKVSKKGSKKSSRISFRKFLCVP